MRKKFVWGKKLYIAGGVLLFFVLAYWILTTFFINDILSSVAPKKLNTILRVVTHGRFAVKIEKITYDNGDILCQNFELGRLRYDTSEQTITLQKINADTIRITGVSLWDLALGNDISMKSMQINSPKFTLTDAKKEQHSPDVIKDTIKLPVTSFDSIVLNNILVFLPKGSTQAEQSSFKGLRLKLSGFFFNPENLIGAPLLYSKQVDFALSAANYVTPDSFYVVQLRNLRASVGDSLITIDSLSYKPHYSEDVFAAKHKYQTGSVKFNCTKVRLEGINVRKLSFDNSFEFRKFIIGTWNLDSYLDRRRPANPHPPRVQLPNELLSSLSLSLTVDTIDLRNGRITIRERSIRGSEGMLFFDRTNILLSPLCTDRKNKNYGAPTHISMGAYFVGEGLLRSTWTYPLMQKSFDLNIHATLGSFDAKKLNTWLVPFERLEVTDGIVESGKIDMNIRSGISTTTVTPVYKNFSMKVLSQDVNKKTGIMEGIKSLIAKIFVVRGNNVDQNGTSAKTGKSSLNRTENQDLMQFIWFSLRKSLGQVVGGFK